NAGEWIDDVILLPYAGRTKRGLMNVDARQHPRGAVGIAQRQRPTGRAGRSLQGEHRTEAAVDERLSKLPLLEQFTDQIDGVALADTSEIHANAASGRADDRGLGIDLERQESRANRHIEPAASQLEHVPRDDQAFQRRCANLRLLTGSELA